MQPQEQLQDKVESNLSQQKVDTNLAPKIDKPVEQPKETEEQINFKKFREERENDRKRREQAELKWQEKENEAQALKAAMDAILNKPSTNSVDNSRFQHSEEEESEDQKIDRKVQIALEQAEKKRIEQNQRKEAENLPIRLVSDYKDFNQVCSSENLDYLDYHYPEVSRAFKHGPDSYDKWIDIYKTVKRFVPNTDSKKEAKKAENNFNKPQSIASQGITQNQPGSGAHILTEDRKKANWERMQRSLKGLS